MNSSESKKINENINIIGEIEITVKPTPLYWSKIEKKGYMRISDALRDVFVNKIIN